MQNPRKTPLVKAPEQVPTALSPRLTSLLSKLNLLINTTSQTPDISQSKR